LLKIVVAGFLVPLRDPSTLAEKLELLIKDPVLRQRMGRADGEKYEQEFTHATFEMRINKILKELIMHSEK